MKTIHMLDLTRPYDVCGEMIGGGCFNHFQNAKSIFAKKPSYIILSQIIIRAYINLSQVIIKKRVI